MKIPNQFKKLCLLAVTIALSLSGIAQVGPGGVDTNLSLWFKADVGTEVSSGVAATDGQDIEFWRDHSGNTFDAEQGTSGSRPNIDFTNTINGNPVLQFNGSGDNFPINTLEYPLGTTPLAITVYSVLATTDTDEGIILSYDRNEYFRFAIDHEDDGGFGLSTTNSSETLDDFNVSGSPEIDGLPHILSGSFDPSILGVNKFLYFDGTISNSKDAGTTAYGSGNTRFGYIGTGSEAGSFDGGEGPTDAYLDGSLGEVIYFGGALTPTQRQQVESYLAIKYGITLSSDTDGDATAFEAGEGDYLMQNGATLVWDASANQTYHNDIAVIANDVNSVLSQASSKSVNTGSIVSMTDIGLVDGDFIAWGNDGVTLSSSEASASTLDRKLDRVWKVEITGTTNNIDDITFDLSDFPSSYLQATSYALLVDDNTVFSSPLEITGIVSGTDVSFSNVDFSSFAGDVFVTLALDLPLPGGVGDGLTFWFKGDEGVEKAAEDAAADGDGVQFWKDQISGFDAQQDDNGERPTLVDNAFNFNPGIAFDGTTHLPITELNYDLTTNTLEQFTIYSIIKSSQSDEGIIVSYDRSSFFRFGLNQQNGTNFGLGTAIELDIDDFNATSDAEDGGTHLIGADYSASSNIKNLFFDGSVDNTRDLAHAPSGSILGSSSEVPRFGYIGANSEADAFNNNDGGSGINGTIGEIIYFESILGATERSQVESYLGIKYGITLSANYVSSAGGTVWDIGLDATYNNMITIVGVDDNASLSQTQSKSENSNSILTISNTGLTSGEYIGFGNDNGTITLGTANTGSQEARIDRVWRVQRAGASTATLAFDLSTLTILPNNLSNYVLLIADDNTFTTNLQEITASSFAGGVATFDNVDLSAAVYVGLSLNPDLDNDLISDGNDLDDDNDGILDSDEGDGLVDTDGDGIVDSRDLDSDNDGIGDLYESGIEASGTTLATLDADGDGIIDVGNIGLNGDSELVYTLSNIDAAVEPVILPDFRDLDSDQNGISDLAESGRGTGLDTDDDGIFEGTDTDQDGVPDEIDAEDDIFGSSELFAQDLDNDGTVDYRDNDNDGDLVEDVDEIGLTDTTPDDGFLDGSTDADGDGILSDRDDDDAVYGQINIVDLLTGSGDDWYSFKTGDWNEPDNWTLDPSGTVRVNPNSLYPSSITDNVYVLNGDEMTLNFNSLIVSSVTVNDGGIIDLGMTTGHNFNVISGAGTIEVASDDFPSGDASDFISTSGGTVSYVDQSPVADYELTTARTFNNMIVNLSANTVVLKADYTLNTDLTITSGTLQINDNTSDGFTDNTTPLYVTVNGDFNTDVSGFLTVGDVDASTQIDARGIYTFHQLELLGDFTNNGSAIFTNLAPASIADGRFRDKYPTAADADNLVGTTIPSSEYGVLEVLFTNGSADQLITLNGPTDFYRIEIAKGTSQNFTAEFNASATSNFRLLGRIAMNQSDDSADSPNIDNNRALGLEAGILKLGDNIVIDQIADEDSNGTGASTQGGNRNYMIDLDAQLWIASNAIVTKENDWGIHPFGKLKVSDNGTLTFTGTGQRTILVDNQGVFEMTGGTVDITQYRNKTGSDGAPRGSFVMTGGTLNVGQGNADGNHAIFSVPWEDQNFILSADNPAEPPVINITLDGNRGKDNAAIQIGTGSGNYNVGESEINIIHTSNTNYKISSAVPLYNLSYDNSGTGELIISDIIDADDDAPGSGGVLPDDNSTSIPTPAQFAVPLVLTHDLTISDGRFNANDQDVSIGNLMTVQTGAEYDPGLNTTIFNGSSSVQSILLNGTTPLVDGGFYNVELSGSGTTKELNGDLATVGILGDLTIGSGVILDDNGKVVQVSGDISHSGTHITDASSPGRIEITGGAASHEIGGDGNGIFMILSIDDGINAISLTADQQIDSVLNLVNGVLDLGTNGLLINSTVSNPIRDDADGIGNFDATRMIQTAGNASDEGLKIATDVNGTLLFPVGASAKYTPVSAVVTSIVDDGVVQINPVDQALALLDDASVDALLYYWRVRKSDFDTDPNVQFTMTYDNGDANGAEASYVPGYVTLDVTRVEDIGGTVDDAGDEISFSTFALTEGDYTAGIDSQFAGVVSIYYAKNNGIWHDLGTWTTDAPSGGADVATLPGAGDVVVVGYNNTGGTGTNYAVAITDTRADGVTPVTDYAPIEIAKLVILRDGGGESSLVTIDGTAGDHDFGFVTNDDVDNPGTTIDHGSKIIFTTGNLPSGDFGDFSTALNTLVTFSREFPGSNSSIIDDAGSTIPNSFVDGYTIGNTLTEYPNLQFENSGETSGTQQYIEFPDVDITVNGQMRFFKGPNRVVMNSSGADGDVTVKGDIVFNSADDVDFEFPAAGANARTLILESDLDFDDEGGAVRYIAENAASTLTHKIQLYGDVVNADANSSFLLDNGAGNTAVSFEFIGSSNSTIPNMSTIPAFHSLIVNKGSDQSVTATINTDFTLGASTSGITKPIDLQNGTLILNNPGIDIDVNSGGGDFTIPATTALELQDGTVRVTATGSGVGNGLRLNGKMVISGGSVVLDGGGTADNYLEYGTGGSSEIEITSGNLVVGSQLRRNLFSDDGVIAYTQTGGSAVFGVNSTPDDSRGTFEIINTGAANSSSFTLTGGSTVFAIVGSSDTPSSGTFIIDSDVDVNLSTDVIVDFGFNGTVAGVTVQNALNENYKINSASDLPNVRVNTFNSPTVEIVVQDLTILESLEIQSTTNFVTNDFDLTINNGFTNDGNYDPGSNTTIFNGVSQLIEGSTSTLFNNLDVLASTSLTLSNTITVNGDLDIQTGILDDAGFRVSLLGDLSLATETVSDGTGTGGISFDNTTGSQEINLGSGSAEMDFIRLNNADGVTINDNGGAEVILTLDDQLALDDGILSIGDNRLVLDDNVIVTSSAGSFNETRMISVNGVKKSDGVERQFTGSDVASFEIPVGTPGKYTPVILDINAADAGGSILVKPINSIHPSADATIDGNAGTLDALNYYWLVSTNPSSITGFDGSVSFQYIDSDANEAGQGQNEAAWTGVRLIAPNWFKPPTAEVDEISNTITFDNTDLTFSGGDATFDGEYTAGADIPDELAQYRSNTTGIWNLAGNWDLEDDGDGLFDDGNGIPEPGTVVIVQSGDIITMSSATDDNQNIFSLQIDGTLDIEETDGHNFGDVSGTGTLRVRTGTLPGGNYDNFFTTTGGVLDMGSSDSWTLSQIFTDVRGLILSDGGTKTLPVFSLNIGNGGIQINDGATLNNSLNNNDITVDGNVNIVNGSFLLGGSAASVIAQSLTLSAGTLTSSGAPLDLSGDMNLNAGTFNAGSATHSLEGDFNYNTAATFTRGSSRITFDGSVDQGITSNGTTLAFHNIRADKTGGSLIVGAGTDIEVYNRLGLLNNSVINTVTNDITLRLVGLATYASGTNGYVDGALSKDLDDEATSFIFRVGKGSTYKPIEINPLDGSYAGDVTWISEYFNITANGYSSGNGNTVIDLTTIETNGDPSQQVESILPTEFWQINSNGVTASLETISIDGSNNGATANDIDDQLLQVMAWDEATSTWNHLGGTSSGTPTAYNLVSNVSLSFSERIVTAGAESGATLPVELISFKAAIDDYKVSLDWSTASELDNDYFEIQKSTDGVLFETIGEVDGNGTSQELNEYSYDDFAPILGFNYYRLKQVDYDGIFEYSPLVSVFYDTDNVSATEFKIYPNPSIDGTMTVSFEGAKNEKVQVTLIDQAGRSHFQSQQTGYSGNVKIKLPHESGEGIYLLIIQSSQSTQVERVIFR